MTDDEERLKRLTELARRVWPQHPNLCIDAGGVGWSQAVVLDGHPDDPNSDDLLRVEDVPLDRALDALEAALYTLAGETSLRDDELATKWEWQAEQFTEPGVRTAFLHCAARLRAKAKPQG
jgi:hypothetical protein